MGFMMLFWVAILAVVILAVLRHHPGHRYWHEHGHSCGYDAENPREIARRRYAKGELTKEQFDQLLKDLG